jgi:hypothetical protein
MLAYIATEFFYGGVVLFLAKARGAATKGCTKLTAASVCHQFTTHRQLARPAGDQEIESWYAQTLSNQLAAAASSPGSTSNRNRSIGRRGRGCPFRRPSLALPCLLRQTGPSVRRKTQCGSSPSPSRQNVHGRGDGDRARRRPAGAVSLFGLACSGFVPHTTGLGPNLFDQGWGLPELSDLAWSLTSGLTSKQVQTFFYIIN